MLIIQFFDFIRFFNRQKTLALVSCGHFKMRLTYVGPLVQAFKLGVSRNDIWEFGNGNGNG